MRLPLIIACLFAVGCTQPSDEEPQVTGRWYTKSQVRAGEPLYQQFCAVCHGSDASATADWRTLDENGNYPPPPLNGSAHTWHHPLAVLEQTIAEGGAEFGGVMPGFGSQLNKDERRAIVAWFQSIWTDDIYARWLAIEQRN